ncbi:MAG: hypothetical protein C0395_08200 [Gemmatimonas sp.]|nr:hypothetical protein [Gemmatimonas sp.]
MRSIPACLLCLMILSGAALLGCNDEDTPGLPHTGTIVIDPEPDDIDAPWRLLGPEGFDRSGAGDTTHPDLAPGDYTLTWGEVSGWSLPIPPTATMALSSGGSTTFEGAYLDRYPIPDTPDRVMTNFRNAYDEMLADEYAGTLHADFIFVFVDGSPVAPPSGFYTRSEELLTTIPMFSGEQGHDEAGVVKPGVRDVDFRQLTRLSEWEIAPESDPHFPGVLRALYDVEVVFVLDVDWSHTLTVDSQQLFYVTSVGGVQRDSSEQPHYYLVGQLDLDSWAASSPLAANEDMSWSIVKALYYSPPDPLR